MKVASILAPSICELLNPSSHVHTVLERTQSQLLLNRENKGGSIELVIELVTAEARL
jgi:hypothetical protein